MLKIVKEFRENENAGTMTSHLQDPYPNRHKCGAPVKFSVEVGRAIVNINLEFLGELSNAQLADKLAERGYGRFSESSVRRWVIAIGAKHAASYLKPTLTTAHMLNRLDWVINEATANVNGDISFTDNYNTVHIDEAWYYMRRGGTRARMMRLPNGEHQTFETNRTKSKRYIGKVMFIGAMCRPHPTHPKVQGGNEPHDGKASLHSFTDVGTYTRGRLAGEERIINVSVTGEEYCRMMHQHIVPDIMRSMWWFHKDSGMPEAGQTVYIQQDGASPHTCNFAQRSLRQIESAAFFNRRGFRFRIATQPAQPPDLNVLDLAIWHSNKRALKGKRWATLLQMVGDIGDSWEAFPAEKVESAFRSLYGIYRWVLRSGGDNDFSHHDGDRKLRRQELGPDRSCPRDLYDRGCAERDRLMGELDLHAGDTEPEDGGQD